MCSVCLTAPQLSVGYHWLRMLIRWRFDRQWIWSAKAGGGFIAYVITYMYPWARCLITWTFPRSNSLIFLSSLWVQWEGHAPIQSSTGHNFDMVLTSLTLSSVELSTDGMKLSSCDITAGSILWRKGWKMERWVVVSGFGCSKTFVSTRWAIFPLHETVLSSCRASVPRKETLSESG